MAKYMKLANNYNIMKLGQCVFVLVGIAFWQTMSKCNSVKKVQLRQFLSLLLATIKVQEYEKKQKQFKGNEKWQKMGEISGWNCRFIKGLQGTVGRKNYGNFLSMQKMWVFKNLFLRNIGESWVCLKIFFEGPINGEIFFFSRTHGLIKPKILEYF